MRTEPPATRVIPLPAENPPSKQALGAPALAGGAGGAAAKDARVDAALANLSSHYPVVTPAASVYEVLGFAAQTRHAKNYADLLAGASDAGGGSGSGDASASTCEKGDGEASAAAVVAAAAAPPSPPAAGASSSDGSRSSAVVGATPSAAKDKQTTSPGGGSGNSEGIGGFGGMASAFAAAAAAFTAADSSNPPAVDQVVSRSVSPEPEPAEVAPSAEEGVAGVEGGAAVDQVGDVDRSSGASAGEQPVVAAPATVDVAVAKTAPDSQGGISSSAGDSNSVVGSDKSIPAAAAATNTTTTTTMISNKQPASPCLALATERPFVFAATLADDALESLHAEGAGATGRRGSEFVVGISEEEDADADAEAAGGGGEGGAGDDGNPAAVVARAVEALLRGGGAGSLGAGEVDAATKVCTKHVV